MDMIWGLIRSLERLNNDVQQIELLENIEVMNVRYKKGKRFDVGVGIGPWDNKLWKDGTVSLMVIRGEEHELKPHQFQIVIDNEPP